MVGEGWHERKGGPHAEVNAIAAAGERARGSTLYVTMEPCSHHGSTPPCVDAVLAAGITRVVAGSLDAGAGARPRPGAARAQPASRPSSSTHSRPDGRTRRGGRGRLAGRPFVTYKVAVTLDGRVTVPGSRWISGDESRRLVHELRAASDAVAVGMGTVRADDPRLDARDVATSRQPRRLAFGHGPLPDGIRSSSSSRARWRTNCCSSGRRASRSCSRAGRRSRPRSWRQTWSTSCSCSSLRSWAAHGPRFLGDLSRPVPLYHLDMRSVGKDILLTAYVHEP